MPFTQDAFLDVFAAYNQAVWPLALGLWVLTGIVFVAFVVRMRVPHALLFYVLAVNWVWAGLIYHAIFFTQINPAAWVFATLFLAQGIILFMIAQSGRTSFQPPSTWRTAFSSVLIVYALAYPAVVWADGFAYPRMPTFGVPCPTAILTIGLFLAVPTSSVLVAAIPVLWSLIAGSAAWLFGVHADLALPVAAVVLAIDLTLRRSHVMRKISLAGVLAFLIGVPVFAAPQQHQHDQQAQTAQPGDAKMGKIKMAGTQMGDMMEKKKAANARLDALMAQVKSSSGEAKVNAMAEVIALLLEERTAMQDHCATTCSMMKGTKGVDH